MASVEAIDQNFTTIKSIDEQIIAHNNAKEHLQEEEKK